MDVFEAIADPTRRRLLDVLAEAPMPATSLVSGFAISQPAISRHLRVLREADLVQVSTSAADARLRVYQLNAQPMRLVEAWLRGFWQGQLDAFATYVREQP
jgi:DNA-binding transcriptional ArsR family regulator